MLIHSLIPHLLHMKDKVKLLRLMTIGVHQPMQGKDRHLQLMTIDHRLHMQDREELLNLDGMVWLNNSGLQLQLPHNLTH